MSFLTSTRIQRYIYLKSIASTNDHLSEYLSKSNPQDSICIYSFEQTGGKGQIGRKWFSDSNKNISLSLLVHYNSFPVKDHFLLNKGICLALLLSIKELYKDPSIMIKWPNDIYVKDRKLAGLLIQNQIKSHKIQNSVIGIGLNLNQEKFPEELKNAISLKLVTGLEYDLMGICRQLPNKFLTFLDTLLKDPIRLESLYQEHLYGLNQMKRFKIKEEDHETAGIIRGVSQEGKLILEIGPELKEFIHGEIALIL